MKGVKGKFLKKLKSIRPVGYLKPQDRILQVSASDGYVDSYAKSSDLNVQAQLVSMETEQKKMKENVLTEQEPDVIDVTELMKDLEDEESGPEDDLDDKENIRPKMKAKNSMAFKENLMGTEHNLGQNRALEASEESLPGPDRGRQIPLSEIDISSFRRPDLDSGSLFDPNLLAAFQQAVMEYMKLSEAERISRRSEKQNLESNVVEPEPDPPSNEEPLLCFEEKCVPGSSDSSVILYTTTLRGIRKTFDDCNSVRFLLQSFRVVFYERDVSMHMEFREELWQVLDCKAVPPKLFIKGRYIGGAEEVLTLHEQGKLKPLFHGVPIDRSIGPCEACDGVRFVVCFKCSGSCKVIGQEGQSDKCSVCNENGLIICPLCC
ncbi:hypothetical protein CerSpe_072420 [Prunus speciosa]